MSRQTVLGIDPGRTGALGLITLAGGWKFVDGATMPTKNVGKTTEIIRPDEIALAELLRVWGPTIVVVENVQPMPATKDDRCPACNREKDQMPARHAFNFGWTCAAPTIVATVLGFEVVTATPVKWKNAAGLPKRIGRTDTQVKHESRRLAQELWPDAPLDQAKDHALAEALLIARFGLGARVQESLI